MDRLESGTHSFVIRIWREQTAKEAGHVVWRGHIKHIPSQEQRSVQNVIQILAFIVPYLEGLGVRTGLGWWVTQCLNISKQALVLKKRKK